MKNNLDNRDKIKSLVQRVVNNSLGLGLGRFAAQMYGCEPQDFDRMVAELKLHPNNKLIK